MAHSFNWMSTKSLSTNSILISKSGHHNPVPSDGDRAHSPPIDERDHEMLMQPLSLGSSNNLSPDSPRDYEKLQGSINSYSRPSNSRLLSPGVNDEQTAQQHESEMPASETPATMRAAETVSKGKARVGVHELPVSSQRGKAV